MVYLFCHIYINIDTPLVFSIVVRAGIYHCSTHLIFWEKLFVELTVPLSFLIFVTWGQKKEPTPAEPGNMKCIAFFPCFSKKIPLSHRSNTFHPIWFSFITNLSSRLLVLDGKDKILLRWTRCKNTLEIRDR